MTPPVLDRAIRRCLSKDPEQRWQTARDLQWELMWTGESMSSEAASAVPRTKRNKRELLAWIAAGLFSVIAFTVFWAAWRQPHTGERRLQFKIDPPAGADFVLESGGGNAISPDGRTIVFVAVALVFSATGGG